MTSNAQPFTPANAISEIADFIADPVDAATFPEHRLRWRHDRAASDVGLSALSDDQWIAHFGRFEPLPGSLPQPLALRYHGHSSAFTIPTSATAAVSFSPRCATVAVA